MADPSLREIAEGILDGEVRGSVKKHQCCITSDQALAMAKDIRRAVFKVLESYPVVAEAEE